MSIITTYLCFLALRSASILALTARRLAVLRECVFLVILLPIAPCRFDIPIIFIKLISESNLPQILNY